MYEERSSRYPGAVLWQRTVRAPDEAAYPVLPDGCMDLLWADGRLLVAGPDTQAYVPEGERLTQRIVGLRFAPGTAPALLGVPADQLRDQRVDLADLWPTAEVRRIAARLRAAPEPAAALEAVA
ncbi:AraC family transcriptional regulator, partial [Streptomyces sp. T-3]|nr:AraC family transcriptional regulator [Streptomyces sp. T-3]